VRAISVRQPWAGLIVDGVKDVENRNSRTHVRETICIQASLKPDLSRRGMKAPWSRHQNRYGEIIGTVKIVGCVRSSRSVWAIRGRWHWILEQGRPLQSPIPYKGRLGFFHVPDRLLPPSRCR